MDRDCLKPILIWLMFFDNKNTRAAVYTEKMINNKRSTEIQYN